MSDHEDDDLDTLDLETMIGFGGSLMAGLKCHPGRHHLVYGVGSTVVVENIETGKQDFLVGHRNTVSCVEISKSGKFIASGQVTYSGFKADIIIWDFEMRELYARLILHRNNVEALSFTCDDRYLMSLGGQDDGCVVVWNVTAKDAICGSPAQKASDGLPYVLACANHTNKIFITAGRDTIRVWHLNVEDRKINPTDIRLRKFVRVSRCIAIDETDTFFFLGTTTGDIMKVSIPSCKMAGHGPDQDRFTCGISSLVLLKNGEIAVGCGDGTIAIVTANLKRTSRETKVEGMVTSIAPRGVGTQFYAGTALSNVYSVTNLGTELKPQLIKTSHYEAINGLAFPYACSEIIATCSKQDIRLWYLKTRQELVRITVPNHTCMAIAIMKDGKTIVSGWSDCRIRAFYPESGKPMYVVNSAFGAMVTAIATYSDCQKIVSGSDLGHVVVWNVPQWRVTNDLNYATKHFLLKEHKATVTCIKMLKDDTECVTSSIDGSCVIWDLVHRHRRHMLRVNTLFMYACYHPAEHQLLTTGTDRKIGFWESYDASMIRELDGSLSGSVNAMDINSDGTCFVTGGDDKMIKLWKYEEGVVTHLGRGHSAPITYICISPDESCIISVSADGAILCWTYPGRKVPEEVEPEPESTKGGSDEIIPAGSPSKVGAD